MGNVIQIRSAARRGPSWRDWHRYLVTSGTIGAATIASLALWTHHDISLLVEDARIRRGELWRLVTCALPHANVLHYAFNVYWVWVFGTLVESQFGALKTLAIYLVLAVASGGMEYAFLDGGIGLSGVGYGLFGMLAVLQKRYAVRFYDAVDTSTTTMFVGWFFLCIATTMTGWMRIANIAHGVGALAGALLGWAISPRAPWRALAAAATAVLVLAAVAGATVVRGSINLSPRRGLDEAQKGYEALEAGRDDDAVRWLLDATTLRPVEPGSWFNLGLAYRRTGQQEKAHAAFAQAVSLDPTDPKYRAALGASK